MSQVFHPRFGLFVKLGLFGLALMAVVVVSGWRALTAAPHAVGEPVEQPVPFSHKHHVGDDGIDCRYCHLSVETSAFAGIPPIATCMTCHSQLYTDQPALAPLVKSWESGKALHWNRVNDLPDFVYFNHSIHIDKGVGCVSCHGRVDRMPLMQRAHSLSMKWCLECHRAPQQHLRPRRRVFDMEWQPPRDPAALGKDLALRYHIMDSARLTECSVCHR